MRFFKIIFECLGARRKQELLLSILEEQREQTHLLRSIARHLQQDNRVLGGVMHQTGDFMQTITPGNSPQFQVTPTFSGAPFALVAANASVSSSDPVNFPVILNADDPTGTIFTANLPADAEITEGGKLITITWTYTNADGTEAEVTGTVTEEGIVDEESIVDEEGVDDVTGGTFAQIA